MPVSHFFTERNMKVADVLQQYNTDRPNQVEDERKLQWLRTLDAQVLREVIHTHEGTKNGEEEDVDDLLHNFGMDTVLLIPEPYGDVYTHYLDEQIALMNNDIDRYNTSSTLYNNAYLTYQQWYNRTHRPMRRPSPLFDHRRLD